MTEIKFKDVQHLYSGCELYTGTGKVTLIATQMETLVCKQRTIVLNGNQIHELHGEFKPLLRPLSSMTEEDAIHMASLTEHESHFINAVCQRNKFDDLIVVWDSPVDGLVSYNSTGELFWCAEQVLWLTKNGFDIFNLLNSGEALDATEREGEKC